MHVQSFLRNHPRPTSSRWPDVFKNIQVLKGIPVSEFMGTMGFFSASLGLNCVYCHVADSLQDWQKFGEDVPRERMARVMIHVGVHGSEHRPAQGAVRTTPDSAKIEVGVLH